LGFRIPVCRRCFRGLLVSRSVLPNIRRRRQSYAPGLQIPRRTAFYRAGLGEEAAMIEVLVQYLTFMGDLMLGVAIWIAPGALGIFAYRLWRKLR